MPNPKSKNKPISFCPALLAAEGSEWFELRTKLNRDMMRPQAALYYTEKLQVSVPIRAEIVETQNSKSSFLSSHLKLKAALRFEPMPAGTIVLKQSPILAICLTTDGIET